MGKKLTLLVMAIGAIAAFAAPSMAGAAQLTMPAGTGVAVGTSITGTSTNTVTTTELGKLTCATVVVKAGVTTNSGGVVKASGEGEGTSSVCELGTNAISITHIKLNTLESTTAGHGVANLSFEADLPGGLTCKYESETGGTALTYTSGASSLHLAGPLKSSPILCGEEQSIAGDYALTTTSGGGSVLLD